MLTWASAAPWPARTGSSQHVPRAARRTPGRPGAPGERSRDSRRRYRRTGPSQTFRQARTRRTRLGRRSAIRSWAVTAPRHPLSRADRCASRSNLLVDRHQGPVNGARGDAAHSCPEPRPGEHGCGGVFGTVGA